MADKRGPFPALKHSLCRCAERPDPDTNLPSHIQLTGEVWSVPGLVGRERHPTTDKRPVTSPRRPSMVGEGPAVADQVQSQRVLVTSEGWLLPSALTGREGKGNIKADIKAERTGQPETDQLRSDWTGGKRLKGVMSLLIQMGCCSEVQEICCLPSPGCSVLSLEEQVQADFCTWKESGARRLLFFQMLCLAWVRKQGP